MAVVTVDDLQRSLPLHMFSAEEQTAASVILDELQGEMETFLGRPLETATFTEQVTYRRGDTFVVLSKTPVISVASVGVASTPGGTLTTIPTTGYVVQPWGIDEWWPYGYVTVEYTAGLFDAKPEAAPAIKRLIRQAAKRAMAKVIADQVGLTRVSVDGGTTLQWLGDGVAGREEDTFTDGELDRVRRWRRKVGTRAGALCTPPLTW